MILPADLSEGCYNVNGLPSRPPFVRGFVAVVDEYGLHLTVADQYEECLADGRLSQGCSVQ